MKDKAKKLFLPGFIIFIMVTSAIGFVYVSPTPSENLDEGSIISYNGVEFIQNSQKDS